MSASDLDGRSSRLSESSGHDWPLRIAMLFIFLVICVAFLIGFFHGLPVTVNPPALSTLASPPSQVPVPIQASVQPPAQVKAEPDNTTAMFREFQAYQRGLKEGSQR